MFNIITTVAIVAVVFCCMTASICALVSWGANYLAREEAVDAKLDYWESIAGF